MLNIFALEYNNMSQMKDDEKQACRLREVVHIQTPLFAFVLVFLSVSLSSPLLQLVNLYMYNFFG